MRACSRIRVPQRVLIRIGPAASGGLDTGTAVAPTSRVSSVSGHFVLIDDTLFNNGPGVEALDPADTEADMFLKLEAAAATLDPAVDVVRG